MTTHPRAHRSDEGARRLAPILGAILIAALALPPLLLGLALAGLTHLTALRLRWLIIALAVSLTLVIAGDPRASALTYLKAAAVWRLPAATHAALGAVGLFSPREHLPPSAPPRVLRG